MTTSQPSLDPRKIPWKRGDVCTMGFKKSGFVLSHTAEYLEVMWMPGGIVERLTGEDAESVIRVAHADSRTARSDMTNLEALRDIEALQCVGTALAERMKTVKNDIEKKELDALAARCFDPKCAFDRRHSSMLFELVVNPNGVSWYWKLRERLHRFVHDH